MAHPSPLVVRWRTYKKKARKSSYFARGLQKNFAKGGFDQQMIRKEAVYQYAQRVGDGPRVEDLTKTILTSLLDDRFNHFNHHTLEETFVGFVWIFFSGPEYFIVEKKDTMLRQSGIYSSKDNLIRRWKCNALTWVKKEFLPPS